ncbi:MAG: hypothetical protein KKH28_11025 [Elusimicrobia bacterium]|nr:hypothetical protein [Elusimicrobiota bacterium]
MARVQLEIDDDEYKLIKKLMGATRIKTFKAFFDEILSLYQWSFKERHIGNIIAALNERSGQYKQVAVPSLERVAPSAEQEQLMATEPVRAPNLAQDSTWNTVLGQVKARGNERFQAEKDRMHQLGIVDQTGQPKSKEWPADMSPDSKTDVTT